VYFVRMHVIICRVFLHFVFLFIFFASVTCLQFGDNNTTQIISNSTKLLPDGSSSSGAFCAHANITVSPRMHTLWQFLLHSIQPTMTQCW